VGLGVGPVHCRRFGGVREVGLMAVFLSSDAAAHVTGQPFVIDGGTSLV
jgi:NAD(P)-dependent dehydrogenase (short-subunit alcohol dehydrogenase family)